MCALQKKPATTVPLSLVESGLSPDPKKGRPTGRVTKRDWLNAALHLLVSGGVDAVRINDLARQLKVSKSGFYWHFSDRSDLLEAIKRFWIEEFSSQFVEHARARNSPLREKLVALVESVRAKESGKLDLAFASWAQNDASVRVLVDHVRDLRIAFVKELLAETGASEPELTTRARLFVTYFMWSEIMFERGGSALDGEDLNGVLDIIVGASPK